MQPFTSPSPFSNVLSHSASPYLRACAESPVAWLPWSPNALERAKQQNLPILLSVGTLSSASCQHMDREIFGNLSIAAHINRCFVPIKVDRLEHPDIDYFAMVTRQLMTHSGGWPNHVFLTPELEPFYAGGFFDVNAENDRQPGFADLLASLHQSWLSDEQAMRNTARQAMQTVREFALFTPLPDAEAKPTSALMTDYVASLKKQYQPSTGGFTDIPKFPQEPLLSSLLLLHEYSGDNEPFDMVLTTLGRIAAGGMNDHIGCGFHPYAIDSQWYIPAFDKSLVTQAMLARLFADAARLTGNAYLADVARATVEFASSALADASGAFYSAACAQEAYYSWSIDEIETALLPQEREFFLAFYALAELPRTDRCAIVARQPLYLAALEQGMPYEQLAAMSGHVMNKLLTARNARSAPLLDYQILTGANGLMIDALAYAGEVLQKPAYTETARRAADYLLEHAIDNEGRLYRSLVQGRRAQIATLEDYSYLIKGLISPARAQVDDQMLNAATALMAQAHTLFADDTAPGYFVHDIDILLPLRMKNADDGLLPSTNAVMAGNWLSLYEITDDAEYFEHAQRITHHFLQPNSRSLDEYGNMLTVAVRLEAISQGRTPLSPATYYDRTKQAADDDLPSDVVTLSAELFPADAKPGDACELAVHVLLKDGWYVPSADSTQPFTQPTLLELYGVGVEPLQVLYPDAIAQRDIQPVYEGEFSMIVRFLLHPNAKGRPPLHVLLRVQPGNAAGMLSVREYTLTL